MIMPKNWKILGGKPIPEDIIFPEAATAFKTYLGYTKSSYSNLKRYTDSIGRPFLPGFHKVTEELKFGENEAVVTIKGPLDKHMERTLLDLDIEVIMVGMVIEYAYGKENIKFELVGDSCFIWKCT